jgi:Tfp pilus assembly protein PilO
MMRDLLEKISRRELHMLLLGIGAIVSAAIIVTILVPNAKALRAAKAEVRMLKNAAQDSVALEQHLQQKHESIAQLQYQLHGDMANLPSKEVEAFIIGRLQRISWNNDIELVSVAPAAGERVKIFQEMLFQVQIAGRYQDVYKWLWEARNDLGFVVIKEFSLRRNDGVDDEPRLMADLSLASYRAVK